MSALGSLVVKLALEYAEYTKGLNKADQEALKFAQNAQRHFDAASASTKEFFVGVVQGAATAAAAYLSVSAAISALGNSIDTLAKLDDMAQKTGSSVENLSKLQKVATATGADFGAVDSSISKLAKGMATVDSETNKTNKALSALGISSKDAAGKMRDPSQVMVDVARKLQDYEDGAGKAALATDLFGKSGADLLPYLNDLAEKVDNFAGVSAEAAAKATLIQDQLGVMKVNANDLFTRLAVDLLPAMNDFVGALIDVHTESSTLTGDGSLTSWADDAAVGLARLLDVAILIPRTFRAIGGSFEAVAADVIAMNKVAAIANPIGAGKLLLQGKNPNDEIKAALAERNAIVEQANKRYVDLWTNPANKFEQSMLDRIAKRQYANIDQYLPEDGAKNKEKPLAYRSGNATKAPKEQISDYERFTRSINEKIAAQELEMQVTERLTDGEKLASNLMVQMRDNVLKLTDAEKASLATGLEKLILAEKANVARREADQLEKSRADAAQKGIATAFESVEKLQQEVDTYGMLPAAITRVTIAKLEAKRAALEANEGTASEIAQIEALIIAKNKLLALQNQKQDLDAMFDTGPVESFGDAIKKAFAGAGSAMTGLTNAFGDYLDKQEDADKKRKKATLEHKGDSERLGKAIEKVNAKERKDQINSYAEMAGAAKGFFSEQTAGYKLMQATEQTFRAIQIAGMIQAAITDTATTQTSVANSGERTIASTIAGAAKAFEQMGVWGFVGAAAILAFMAAIGGGASGGGGSNIDVAKERQDVQGTGSVLGDESAKSESIANAIELLSGNSNIALEHSSKMLSALRSIESGIAGMAKFVSMSSGLRGTTADQKALGIGSQSGFLGWGDTETVLDDSGIVIEKHLASSIEDYFADNDGWKRAVWRPQNIGEILDSNNIIARGYSDVTTTESNWFGSDSSSEQVLQDLKPELKEQLVKTLGSMYDVVLAAGQGLGKDGGILAEAMRNVTFDDAGIFKISLKGMTGSEAGEELMRVFSSMGDAMVKKAMPEMTAFQKVGEGMLETVVRMASGVEVAQFELEQFGLAAINYADIVNKQGDIGAEIVRQTIVNSQRLGDSLTGVGEIMSTLDGTATDLAETYADLLAVQDSLAMVGIDKNALGRSMIRGARDLGGLQSGLDAYFENFFTSAEQLGAKTIAMRDKFAALGQVMPNSIEGFRALVDSIPKTTEEGEMLVGQLVLLAEGFADLQNESKSGVSDAFAALQESVEAERTKATKDYESAIDPVTKKIDKLRGLSDALQSSLNGRNMPVLFAMNYAAAKAQIGAALAIARVGGAFPDAKSLQGALSTVSQPTEQLFATFTDYQRDFLKTSASIKELAGLTDDQLSVEERTLKVAEDAYKANMLRLDGILTAAQTVVDVLNGIKGGVLSLPEAIANFNKNSTAAGGGTITMPDNSGGVALSSVINPAGDALLSQISAYGAANGANSTVVIPGVNDYAEKMRAAEDLVRLGAFVDTATAFQTAYGMSQDQWEQIEASIPKFDVGTNYVPRNMLAMIHEGEAIVPKAYNPAANGTTDNAELVSEIRNLRIEVAGLRSAADKTATATGAQEAFLRRISPDGNSIKVVVAA